MLQCRFSFKEYAKNLREEATKCPLKLLSFYWMLMDMCLHINLIFIKVQYYSKLFMSWFFLKKSFVWCPIWNLSFQPDNLSGLKNYYIHA